MTKIRSVTKYLKPNLVWIMWAAILAPWVEGIAVPLSPRIGEVL